MLETQFYFEFNLLQKDVSENLNLEDLAFEFNSTGIEEFSLEESKVDEILGTRSYSGGDLPKSILDEVEETLDHALEKLFKIYFINEQDARKFQEALQNQYNIESTFVKKDVIDWNQEWRKHYEPIKVSDALEIIPAWLDEYQSVTEKKLMIYPGMGFGTGGHETTFLCLKGYLDYRHLVALNRCLDFGCGSGILGLATLLFEPSTKVDLYDIDDEAIANCQQNIDLNKLQDLSVQLLGSKGKSKISGQYEVVFANILQNVLLSERDIIIDSVSKDGLLILSGLLKGQEEEVIKAYQNRYKDFELLEIYQKNDWVSVVLRKS